MHRYLRYAILENLDTVHHIQVGRVLGVAVAVTPWIWLHPIVFFGLHLALGALGPRQTPAQALQGAVAFVVGVALGTVVHALGHILGGKLVGSPMDELLLTATRGVNIYHGDQSALPGRVHLGRAVGGPALNLLFASMLAAVLGWLWPAGLGGLLGETLNGVVSTSLYIGLGGLLLPLPSVDGWVIWRELLRASRGAAGVRRHA